MRRTLALALSLLLCLLGAVARAEEIDWRACEGGELMVYIGCDDDHGAAVLKAFQQKTGINVSYARISGTACLNRVRREREDTKADFWYGGTWDSFITAADEGLLHACGDFTHAPYKSANYGVGEPYWFGIYSGYIGFVCDMGALAAAGVEPPASWEDLARPEYAGMICLANPASASTGLMTVSVLYQIFDEERARELLAAIDANVCAYVNTGSGVAARVADGRAAIGVCFLHSGLRYVEEGREDIQLFAPSEGTGYEVGGAAILEGCKHPDEARLFLSFVMTPECQEIGKSTGALQFLTVEGASDPEAASALTEMGVKLIDYDAVWTSAHRDELLAAWKAAATPSKLEEG